VDANGDYVTGYAGSRLGDLDVLAASALLNTNTNDFTLSGTMAANIGSSAGGFYVWGVDRGNGTARFGGNGITGVLFDMVVILNADGSGRINDLVGGLPAFVFGAGTAAINGATISIDLDMSLLPSRGLAAADYSWNLWPRDGSAPAGFGQISDFAPDNSNIKTQTVPEPTSALLALAALGLAGSARTARRRAG
jgi:MYXO-CTERM domain-containing protein